MNGFTGLLSDPRTIRLCRVVIGAIFIVAALSKLGDVGAFASQVHNFRLMPIAVENLLAMTMPWIELLAGLALVLDVRARAGALLSLALMLVFTIAVGQAVGRNLDIECGCFGTADASKVGLTKLLQNFGMTAIAAIASLRAR